MARIRTIKPEFFQHAELYDAELASGLPLRIAFAGLWTVADKAGRFEWRPRQLKLNVLPYDDVDFAAVLSALESAGFVQRYVAEAKEFGCIPSWEKHQHRNVREPDSTIPGPDEAVYGQVRAPDEAGACTCSVPDQAAGKGKGKGREGKGRGRCDDAVLVQALATPSLDAVAFTRWESYRRELGKPLKPSSLTAAAEELAKHGGDQAAVVQQSVANGWQGLFPLKRAAGVNGSPAAKPHPRLMTPEEIEAEEAARATG